MLLIELTTFEIRTKSMLDRWKKFAESYRARGQDPTVVVFNKWFTDNFRGQGRTVTPNLGAISDLKDSSVSQYLGKALSYYDTGELWQDDGKQQPSGNTSNIQNPQAGQKSQSVQPSKRPQTSSTPPTTPPTSAATTPTTTAPAATPAATPPATPAATPLGPVAGQEIEMPGTNYKYKYSPSWTDAAGNPAPAAVANVLAQLATGTNLSDINFNDLKQARRSIGLTEAKKLRKKLK
jgi:hypothetical protein